MILHGKQYWDGAIWASEMNFGMTHAPGAGSIDRATDLQSTNTVLWLPQKHKGINKRKMFKDATNLTSQMNTQMVTHNVPL